MATSLPQLAHLDALRCHGSLLAERAVRAGLDAEVPSCPDWTVAHLLAHQSMVHRWIAAHVRGEDREGLPDEDRIRSRELDLVAYYRDGHRALVAALSESPETLTAKVFLRDAASPRGFWTRRQAHETSIHAVDALAAQLGRLPTAHEAAIDVAFAVDGVDELVRGFLPGNASSLYAEEPFVIGVRPTDSERAWTIRVGPELETEDGGAGRGRRGVRRFVRAAVPRALESGRRDRGRR
ncbi:MAG: maleylpyruvate isomerase family mycothiol-dependent enzyme [Nocardioidaceae bacterium]